MGVLFHGSPRKLEIIKPSPSPVVNNDKVVFATPSRWMALVFCAHTTSHDIDFGFVKRTAYLAEMCEGAFDLLKTEGYIHTVHACAFHSDSRVGMRYHEFVANCDIEVVERERVPNAYEDLLRFPSLRMVKFSEREAWLAETFPPDDHGTRVEDDVTK